MQINNRWQAFGVHLGISFVIFLVLLGLIFFIWFPGVFMSLGGYKGIKIVAGVDLVLGPVLTLIVFDKKKLFLKFDLAIIGSIQMLALAFGVWVVYNERPAVQVLSHDGIYVHSFSEFKASAIDISEIAAEPSALPKLVYLDLPKNPQIVKQLDSMSTLVDNRPLTMRTDLYRDPEHLESTNLIRQLSNNEKNGENDCFWVKVDSPHRSGEGCFNIGTGLVLLR